MGWWVPSGRSLLSRVASGKPGGVTVSKARLSVRALEPTDGVAAVAVINTAAAWYADFLAPSELRGPEMTLESWTAESRRLTWFGAFDHGELVGVIGLEYAADAALFRHAYVLPDHQRQGIAAMLHQHLVGEVRDVDKIIVGTYAANYKARDALTKGGYQLSEDSEAVLRRYYDIPEDRLQTSVTYERHLDR